MAIEPYDSTEFCELYPNTINSELALKYSVSIRTINKWAEKYGLKKSKDFLSKLSSKRFQGRKMSEETKKKILNAKIKNGTLRKGSRHYRWKGGKTWERFKEPEYIEWRNKVLERDNYTCQDCNRQCKKSEKGLAAHHLKPYSEYPELRFELDNGITLCRKCHMARHGKTVPEHKVLCACGCGTVIDAFDKYGRRPRQYVNGHAKRGKKGYQQEVILCACGCGKTKNRFDKNGRESLYLKGHASKGKKVSESTKELLRQQRTGKKLSPEHCARVKEGLAKSTKRIGREPSQEWANPYVTQEEFIKLYPTLKTTEMAERCKVTRGTINRWAKKLGILS